MRNAEKEMFDKLVKEGFDVHETRTMEGSLNYCQNAHKSDVTIIGKRGKKTNIQLKNGRSGSVQIREFRRHTYFKGIRNEEILEICDFIGEKLRNGNPVKLSEYFPLNSRIRELLIKGNNFIPSVSNPDVYLYKTKYNEMVEVSIRGLYESCTVYKKSIYNNWQENDWYDMEGKAFSLQFKSLEKSIREKYTRD